MANGLANSLDLVPDCFQSVAPCGHIGLTVGISSEIGLIKTSHERALSPVPPPQERLLRLRQHHQNLPEPEDIADGIESTTDIISSLVVWTGLKISTLPPDDDHPYGHGKAESISAMVVALALFAAGALIAVQSIRELHVPHHTPAWLDRKR